MAKEFAAIRGQNSRVIDKNCTEQMQNFAKNIELLVEYSLFEQYLQVKTSACSHSQILQANVFRLRGGKVVKTEIF